MQLSQLQKITKIAPNKFITLDKASNQNYVLTMQPYSEFNKLLYQLSHPYLLTVAETWEERGQVCSVQKADALSNLGDVAKNYNLSENLILQLLLQISEALEYVEKNEVGSTVTLQNVYLDSSSTVKIDVLNFSNTPLPYASPEYLRKEQTHSGIWSVGCIAYYLITSQMPFQGETEKILAYNIIYKDAPPADFSEYPLIGSIIKGIFTKNIRRRITFRQLNQFLFTKVSVFDLQESIKIGTNVNQLFSKKQSVYSLEFKESQIEYVEQSVSGKQILVLDEKQYHQHHHHNDPKESKPPIPQIITLDMFEEQMNGIVRKVQNRPQSTIVDTSKQALQKLQRMRPNSAIAFNSGKEFIARNIKQEIHNRRIMSSVSQQSQQTIPKEIKINKTQKEVSIDLKDAKRLKNSDLIRVYNLEYGESNNLPSKAVHKRVLQPSSPKNNPGNDSKQQKFMDNMVGWKNKVMKSL